jgi:hypothetical protein
MKKVITLVSLAVIMSVIAYFFAMKAVDKHEATWTHRNA